MAAQERDEGLREFLEIVPNQIIGEEMGLSGER